MTLDTIGFLGVLFFAACAVPQAILSYKQGHSEGLSVTFLLLWTFGEIFTLIYVFFKLQDLLLMINYGGNLILLSIIWRYKLFPRK